LVISAQNTSTLYVGTDYGGVFRTTNSGGNWSAFNSGLGNTYIYALAVDAANPTTIYAGTYGSSVFSLTGSTVAVTRRRSQLISQ
jgi:photosystem II stability/assembly factor-like uncharacterized protein